MAEIYISLLETTCQISSGRFRGLMIDPSFLFSIATNSHTFQTNVGHGKIEMIALVARPFSGLFGFQGESRLDCR